MDKILVSEKSATCCVQFVVEARSISPAIEAICYSRRDSCDLERTLHLHENFVGEVVLVFVGMHHACNLFEVRMSLMTVVYLLDI